MLWQSVVGCGSSNEAAPLILASLTNTHIAYVHASAAQLLTHITPRSPCRKCQSREAGKAQVGLFTLQSLTQCDLTQ